jgi:hypothetical protein
MLEGLKRQWGEFKRGQPGERFQNRYERNRRKRSGRSKWLRFLKPLAAILLIAAGLFFCAIPGPGVPLLIFGAALLADVSRRIAVAMDWLDLRLRALLRGLRKQWAQATLAAKGMTVILALGLLAGAGYGLFRLWRG